jgi:hypothetical protein
VIASPGFWGWKSSDTTIHSPFVRLPNGFSCKNQCDSISSCSGNRNDALCGGCKEKFSFAFFDKSCVPESQCAGWKYGPLCAGAFLYIFLFSVYLIHSNEVAAQQLLSAHINNAHCDEASDANNLLARREPASFSSRLKVPDLPIHQRFDSNTNAHVLRNRKRGMAESPIYFKQYSIGDVDEPRLRSRPNRRTDQRNVLPPEKCPSASKPDTIEQSIPKNDSPFPVLMYASMQHDHCFSHLTLLQALFDLFRCKLSLRV